MNIKSLFSIAAASLGLGIAVIVDQPAAFARCDHGTCPCRDESWTGDSVNHNKCRADQFCAQKVPERGSDHVYVCRPAKPAGWGCTDDRQCKSRKCFTKTKGFETTGKCAASQVCFSDKNAGRYHSKGYIPPKNASPEDMRRFCCKYDSRWGGGKYCEAKNGKWKCKEAPYPKESFYCANGKVCGVGGFSEKASIENCIKVCEDKSPYATTYWARNQCGV